MRWEAIALAALLLTTGCIGLGDDAGDEDEDIDAQDVDEDPDENETEEPVTSVEWSNDTYEGAITGTSFFAPSPPSEQQSFAFEVANGTQGLVINLTTEGGDLSMNVADPECTPGPEATCEETVATEDGEAEFTVESPQGGEWNVRFFPSDPVANDVAYTADVAQGLLVEG